jgi:hypothetical protein
MGDFHENIKQWVLLDNELIEIRAKSKEMRERKNNLTENLYNHAEQNNLDTSTIQISDSILKFQQIKQTSPLTFKLLCECLNDCLGDDDKVNNIIKYIKSKREEKVSYVIKRTFT